nr:MAG TPA: hypothetical protein [Bacteriophage sp.]
MMDAAQEIPLMSIERPRLSAEKVRCFYDYQRYSGFGQNGFHGTAGAADAFFGTCAAGPAHHGPGTERGPRCRSCSTAACCP